MAIAVTGGGAFMFAVHVFAPKMSKTEYGLFVGLLGIVGWMMIPALGLQSVFAQQTAAATTDEQSKQLTGTVRGLLVRTFILWLVIAGVVALFQFQIIELLAITSPAGLWATVLVGLPQLWLPILQGVLQGRQDFLWFGWTFIINGVGRFVAVGIIVGLLHGQAAGAITGALIGFSTATLLGLWRCRDVILGPSLPFDWRGWLRQVVPLTLGLGAATFMMTADPIIVRMYFDPETLGPYGGAGMIGRGLVWFTGGLVAVMFPKVVRSVALSEDTNVVAQSLILTAITAVVVAAGSTIACLATPASLQWFLNQHAAWMAPLQAKLAPNTTTVLLIATLIPWSVWAMVPLVLANVLISNLIARKEFSCVLWLIVVAIAYMAALRIFHSSFFAILRTLGVFNLLLFAVSIWFTWGKRLRAK